MDENPYAPPKAAVEGAFSEHAKAPAIWNPDAAANWCLLFTPIFGIWLHMLNWRALGEPARAESAKTWLMLTVMMTTALCVGGALMPFSGLSTWVMPVSFLFLLAWYFGSARGQAKWVAERYGRAYPRKRWWGPLLGAVVLYVATSLMLTVFQTIGNGLAR